MEIFSMGILVPPGGGSGGGGGGGAGDGEKLVYENISQTAHGFTLLQPLTTSGSGYVLARANAVATSGVVGFCLPRNANAFDLILGGIIDAATVSSLSLTANTEYYLSAATAGAYTSTAPTGLTEFKVLLFRTDNSGNVIIAPLFPDSLAKIEPTDINLVTLEAELDSIARPAQVSAGEKTAGTETALRSFSPDDVKDMIDIHATGGSGIPDNAAILWPTASIGSPPTGYFAAGEYGTATQGTVGGWSVLVKSLGTVANVAFSEAAGEVPDNTDITLSTSTPGASIRYTTGDGSQAAPTRTTGTVYTTAITVTDDVTIKAIAYLNGWVDSAVTSAAYTVPPAVSYLVSEDFESGTTPSGWTAGDANRNYAYATSPAPLVGTYSLGVTGAFTGVSTPDWTNRDEIWFYCQFRPSAASNNNALAFYNTAGTQVMAVQFRSDRVNLEHGSVGANNLGAANTSPSELWLRYVKSSGSNDGIAQLYINKNSVTGVRPAVTISISTGNSTNQIAKMSFFAQSAGTAIADKVRVSTSEIGDNPT